MLALGIAHLGTLATTDARANIAAEAAALAGALSGNDAAQSVAALNGARLISYSQEKLRVTVVVEIKGMRATASADVVGFSTLDAWPSPTPSSP